MKECVRRSKRDGADVLALHSSPIMTAALAMYRDMGFVFHREATASMRTIDQALSKKAAFGW
jgi:ribosomal protein S18 acetylase RimI-like enzyme